MAVGGSDVVLRASMDSSGVVVGANKANQAVSSVGKTAKATGATAAPLSDKMFTLGSSMTMMAGSSNTANQAMMLSVNAMKLMDDAARGVLVASTAIIAAIPVVVTLLITWYQSTRDVTDALKEQADAISGSVDALLALRDSQTEFSKAAGDLVEKLKVLKLEQIALAEASLRASMAETLATSVKWKFFQALEALVDPQTANLLLQYRATEASQEHTVEVEGQLIALAKLREEQVKITETVNDYVKANRNAFLSAKELSTLGAGGFTPFQFDDLSSAFDEEAEDPITASIDRMGKSWKKMGDQANVESKQIGLTFSNELANAFFAGEMGFKNMVQGWIKSLIASGIFRLISGLFTGGLGGMFAPIPEGGTGVVYNRPGAGGPGPSPVSPNVFTTNTNAGANLSSNVVINNYGTDITDINRQLEDLASRRESRLRLA